MFLRFQFPSLTVGGLAVAFSFVSAAETFPPDQIEFFEKNIRPVLAERCYECHSAHKHQNGLRLDSRAAILHGSEYGKVVESGNPSASKLIKAINHAGGVEAMPKKGDKLPAPQIAAFEKWIALGLPWPAEAETAHATPKADPMQHWAFQPVLGSSAQFSALSAQYPGANPIDAFVHSNLKGAGLDFAAPADAPTLIRRLHLTLTGLPPTYSELRTEHSALSNSSPAALQPLISSLLSKPAYGERWARVWLDVVRYADTNGYQVAGRSNFYPYAYTYRDWIVKSLNDDMPYDQFVSYQLAADRLTVATPNSPHLAALGFFNVGERFINDRLLIKMIALMSLVVACLGSPSHAHAAMIKV